VAALPPASLTPALSAHGSTQATMATRRRMAVPAVLATAAVVGAVGTARSFAVAPGGMLRGSGSVQHTLGQGPSEASPVAVPAASTGVGIGSTQGALSIFMASLAVVASGVALGPVGYRKINTKRAKNWRNADRVRRHPPPLLTLKELRKRLLRVQLLRRKDIAATEEAWNYDPRTEDFQMSVADVKRMMETPGYISIEQEREGLGAPMPPFTLMDDAMQVIRGERMGGIKREQPGKKDDKSDADSKKGKMKAKGPSEGIDLSNIDMDFVNFKGIQMTKKELARLQSSGAQTRAQRKARK